MSMYFESFKPIDCIPIKKWQEQTAIYRKEMDARAEESVHLRNACRRLRLESNISKNWDFYYNKMKLENRVYDIANLILYAERILPEMANEKVLISEEKFLTEQLLVNCDTWIEVCMNCLNMLDVKLAKENTRDDEVMVQTRKEVNFLEEMKKDLKAKCQAAWQVANRMEFIQAKMDLNLEFKKEVLNTDKRCLAVNKMDTGISFKVDPLKGPKKMLTVEEWTKEVNKLVKDGEDAVLESKKLREAMLEARGNAITKYTVQFDRTDYELRKRIYEINKEKNECQFQIKRVKEIMSQITGEMTRLGLYHDQVKDDLKCAEARCSLRYFRPEVDATMDPPYYGINEEVIHLRDIVKDIEKHMEALKEFYNRMEADLYTLTKEEESKNKSLQVEIQGLDIRLAGRYDPNKMYAYSPDVLASRMVRQLPPPFVLYSDKF